MKAILKGPGQDLLVKVYRYELALGIIIVLVSRHPVPPKRSPLSFPATDMAILSHFQDFFYRLNV